MNTDLMLLRSILDVILVANVSDLSFSAAMQQKKSVFIPLICVIRVLITRILMRLPCWKCKRNTEITFSSVAL